ncbi:MAG: hypothetical protein SFW62_01910 [Alphaproteobacteria bacterium]|nr:hypothetical protein [Alphaproteobacteria bacterium]
MTDDYGAEHHNHGDQPHESHDLKPETWTDDHPPVDDFADTATEETASVSEELGAVIEDQPDSGQRKSSPLLPIAAGVGGLLILGGILYWQFGTSSPPPSPAPVPMNTASSAPAKIDTLPPSVPTTETPADVTDISDLKAPPSDTAPKTAMASAPETSALPQAPAASGNNVADIINIEPPAPAAALPAPVIPAPAPVAQKTDILPPTDATAPPAALPDISLSKESMETRLADLTQQVDQLKKALDQANQQIGQLALTGGVPATGSSSMETRLSKLEQQMAQGHHSSGIKLDSSDASVEKPHAVTTKPKTSTASRKAKKPARTTQTSSRRTKSSWVLRAATPEEAWVAESAYAPELRHVEVGDQLPGIGRIRSIRQAGDSWVVEGTQGTIR